MGVSRPPLRIESVDSMIGIVDRLGIINQARSVGTSVIQTFLNHLSGMAADKGVG